MMPTMSSTSKIAAIPTAKKTMKHTDHGRWILTVTMLFLLAVIPTTIAFTTSTAGQTKDVLTSTANRVNTRQSMKAGTVHLPSDTFNALSPYMDVCHGRSCDMTVTLFRPRKRTALFLSSTSIPDTSTPTKKVENPHRSALMAVVALFIINRSFKMAFQKLQIAFPAPLGACGVLFATFLFAPFGGSLHALLSPGAAVLAKWLPVFFVPSLITLPLSGGIGSSTEVSVVRAFVHL